MNAPKSKPKTFTSAPTVSTVSAPTISTLTSTPAAPPTPFFPIRKSCSGVVFQNPSMRTFSGTEVRVKPEFTSQFILTENALVNDLSLRLKDLSVTERRAMREKAQIEVALNEFLVSNARGLSYKCKSLNLGQVCMEVLKIDFTVTCHIKKIYKLLMQSFSKQTFNQNLTHFLRGYIYRNSIGSDKVFKTQQQASEELNVARNTIGHYLYYFRLIKEFNSLLYVNLSPILISNQRTFFRNVIERLEFNQQSKLVIYLKEEVDIIKKYY